MPLRIEDYALIGDLETAALVGRDGSIDWLCWPRFDSDACFAALLGRSDHGRWLLSPAEEIVTVRRRYRGDTLILETQFETAGGTLLVTDFMPPRDGASDLVRCARCTRGSVRVRTEFIVRFGYGIHVPWMTQTQDGEWQAIAGPDKVVLRTQAPLTGKGLTQVGEFTLREGEELDFTLTYVPSHLAPPEARDVRTLLRVTEEFWLDWTARAQVPQAWAGDVLRSLITLRALIYEPTGGIIAAPTTSLPEALGGVRNWDYRFCWLRDATLTLLAFMDAGFFEEADAWRHWLLRAVAGNAEQLQIMYGVAGERRLSEWEVPWLPGYEGSTPVRIGNLAHAQLQLDVYGEIMDALHQARVGGLAPLETGWELQCALLNHLAKVWEQPDYGIWEIRGPARHFTHSKIMAWVAFDRAIKDAERYDLPAPLDRWRATRERIHTMVCEHGYDTERNCFVQSFGARPLDASLLLIAPLGFLPADDARVRGTVRAIERHLMHDGFVARYDTAEGVDGLPVGEGAFLACSFWLVDAYAMEGRLEEAHALFRRLTALANDVGLLAEEYHPGLQRLLGNFPQGFSHLSLIASAFNLAAASKPAEQRSEKSIRDAPRAPVR